jgi:hypothetical protein
LVCDAGNHRVRRVAASLVSTIAGNGIQGFAGDGGLATAAELNEPSGVVITPDGRMFIADSANHRVRVITVDGRINTFAGNGSPGFSGDGGPATAAQLSHPVALALDGSGAVLIADQGNQRLRRVGNEGIIQTLAGSGVQGPSTDATPAITAALNVPGGVAVSSFGWPLIADGANRALRILLDDGKLYKPAGFTARTTTLGSIAPDAVYGSAQATVQVSGAPASPQGLVRLSADGTQVAQATLAQGLATLQAPTLSAGTHALVMVYAGDGVHPSATATTTMRISPVSVLVSAADATVEYGAPIPVLGGAVQGVLPQDQGKVAPIFSAAAPPVLPTVGTYPITATLGGAASQNYALSIGSDSGSLHIIPASPAVALSAGATAYAGLPLQLSAQVLSTHQGMPTGSVQFLDSGTVVANAKLVNGYATAVYLSPTDGPHELTVSYSGDQNFRATNSSSVIASILAMPDFGLSVSGSSEQTVLAGSSANYLLKVESAGQPFTGLVSLSASGLPAGAQAIFSPAVVVPGSGAASVAMTIATLPTQARVEGGHILSTCAFAGVFLLPVFFIRPPRIRTSIIVVICGLTLLSLMGCGARTVSESALPVHNYAVTVTATSTNLAGKVVVHSTTLTLGLQ